MTDALTLVFDPLAPAWAIIAAAGSAAAIGLFAARRGRLLRLIAIAALALALMNPALVKERRDALPDVAALVIDRSESATLAGRAAAVEAAAQAVRDAAAADPSLELVEAETAPGQDGTRLFDALARAAADAPSGRLAGVIVISDGQAHDAPQTGEPFASPAPVHALIVGDPARSDRRVSLKRAPPFGIVGDAASFALRIDDPAATPGERVEVAWSLNGADPQKTLAPVGQDIDVSVELERRGPNVVEFSVAPRPNELTLANNRTAISVSGVRDRLRVLLVTGEPHAGARSWRDILKSDPSVDLVHFTILRPPDKGDGTPENELSLIRFPTTQLFEESLNEFDLVIFDRYRRRGVLRMLYFDNIARYVENGGALMVAAGPPFATPLSLARTPLAAVLPARPTGEVIETPFKPKVTAVGEAHPVTAGLAPETGEPTWGRWFRVIEANRVSGEPVLEGPDERPLLILDRVGEGRVALFLSDQAWLWSRGVEGGGPYTELFRRLAHWLMKEPDLEEESLTAIAEEGVLRVRRRTLAEAPPETRVVAPSGEALAVAFAPVAPGLYEARVDAAETGLYRILSGDLSTTAAVGPLNPLEFADLTPTDAILAPTLAASRGGSVFIGEGDRPALPELRRVSTGDARAGRGWIGLVRNEAYAAVSQEKQPLAPALLAVALALGLVSAAWAREGR